MTSRIIEVPGFSILVSDETLEDLMVRARANRGSYMAKTKLDRYSNE